MRVSLDDRTELKRHIQDWIESLSGAHYAGLINHRAQQNEERFLFDVLYAAVPSAWSLYQYDKGLNDNHIKSALKWVFNQITL